MLFLLFIAVFLLIVAHLIFLPIVSYPATLIIVGFVAWKIYENRRDGSNLFAGNKNLQTPLEVASLVKPKPLQHAPIPSREKIEETKNQFENPQQYHINNNQGAEIQKKFEAPKHFFENQKPKEFKETEIPKPLMGPQTEILKKPAPIIAQPERKPWIKEDYGTVLPEKTTQLPQKESDSWDTHFHIHDDKKEKLLPIEKPKIELPYQKIEEALPTKVPPQAPPEPQISPIPKILEIQTNVPKVPENLPVLPPRPPEAFFEKTPISQDTKTNIAANQTPMKPLIKNPLPQKPEAPQFKKLPDLPKKPVPPPGPARLGPRNDPYKEPLE